MIIFLFGVAKFILFAPFIKTNSPKNVIFAAYLSIGIDDLLYIF